MDKPPAAPTASADLDRDSERRSDQIALKGYRARTLAEVTAALDTLAGSVARRVAALAPGNGPAIMVWPYPATMWHGSRTAQSGTSQPPTGPGRAVRGMQEGIESVKTMIEAAAALAPVVRGMAFLSANSPLVGAQDVKALWLAVLLGALRTSECTVRLAASVEHATTQAGYVLLADIANTTLLWTARQRPFNGSRRTGTAIAHWVLLDHDGAVLGAGLESTTADHPTAHGTLNGAVADRSLAER